MAAIRAIKQVLPALPVTEGAGVQLKRAFGFYQKGLFDPFLLLDDFHSDKPDDYLAGFPWHPHRGIETITYLIEGAVEHGDSLGNKGVINAGDVQWMTAGNGIIHQEMPQGDDANRLAGLQLWANLPAKHKMIEPKYRDIQSSQIPVVEHADGTIIKVIAGEIDGITGPMEEIAIQPILLHVVLPPAVRFNYLVPEDHAAYAYILKGQAIHWNEVVKKMPAEHAVIFGDGEHVQLDASPDVATEFLLFAGKPLKESIAWAGPIVMNTSEELSLAFREYRDGTFLKHQAEM